MIYVIVILAVAVPAFIFHKWQLRRLWHAKKDLQRRVVELEGVLQYAKDNEKKAKDEFLALQSGYRSDFTKLNHEIRTPLNSVTGMCALLEGTALNAEQLEYVAAINNGSDTLVTVLNHFFNSTGITPAESDDNKKEHAENVGGPAAPLKLSEQFAAQYPLRILVAEDDLMNQQLAVMILKRLGYRADTAPNGKEVLEIVSEKKYDLILMDVQMPEMDGMEATRMIRLCLTVQPAIIAMTANAMDGDREACLASGMDDYISKPVHVDELMRKLEIWATHLRNKRHSAAK